jgi:hypothetical protein
MHNGFPSVTRLQVHLPNEQSVVFDERQYIMEFAKPNLAPKTTLTEWFQANIDLESARNVSYQDFPSSFTWNKSTKVWSPRKARFGCVGRLYFVSPQAGERFFLRTLLTKVKGATSFESLRTFQGVIHDTFLAACVARGLYEDDNEWEFCL